MSYIDIAIIVIVALGALIGLWRGFFKTLISFFGWFVSFLIAMFITKPIAGALLDVKGIQGFVLGTEGWSLFSWIHGKLPDLTQPGGILGIVLSPLIKVATAAGGDLTTNVALLLANGIFNILVCICLFIIIRLLLLLVTMFANAMTRNKFVGALNRLLGLVLGAVKGAGLVAILMIIMNFMMGLSIMAPVRNQIDNSVIAAPVYKQISRLTDKFLSGNDETLKKLLNITGLDTDEPTANPYAGDYIAVTTPDGGIATTYTLRLKDDYTFTLTTQQHGVSGSSERTGSYAAADGKLTLTFDAAEGQEPETEELDMGAGWVYMWEMYFTKEGVTPPNGEQDPAPPSGEEEPTPPSGE